MSVTSRHQLAEGNSTPAGARYKRFVIRSAMLVDGLGTPARGPVDIVVEGDTVTDIIPVDAVSLAGYGPSFTRATGERLIEADGITCCPALSRCTGIRRRVE